LHIQELAATEKLNPSQTELGEPTEFLNQEHCLSFSLSKQFHAVNFCDVFKSRFHYFLSACIFVRLLHV